MKHELSKKILEKYPQLKQVFLAVEIFKQNGEQQTKCSICNKIIEINENKIEGFLEANCPCGKSKYRMRWNPDKI